MLGPEVGPQPPVQTYSGVGRLRKTSELTRRDERFTGERTGRGTSEPSYSDHRSGRHLLLPSSPPGPKHVHLKRVPKRSTSFSKGHENKFQEPFLVVNTSPTSGVFLERIGSSSPPTTSDCPGV